MNLEDCHIDKSWTLFLDRDGVINRRLEDDYIKKISEFVFLDGVPEAIRILSGVFGKIFVVTNQQGIGKGLMNEADLISIHTYMIKNIEKRGGKIDQIYFCPELDGINHPDRKPQTGMALKAKQDYPEIDFLKSIMVGDSLSDMEFGRRAGMKTVFIGEIKSNCNETLIDYNFMSLSKFAHECCSLK